jgi:monovalent cation:H+ antiporter-2, CPA2 family
MPHEPALISTIAIGLSMAFVAGLVARRLGLPTIVGYLLAGVVIGPFTPGFVADQEIASELAELGVILIMFGVGIHFSVRDLLAVRHIAVPGALGQVAISAAAGTLVGLALGWQLGAAVVLGFSIAIASTVVLLRALAERNELDSPQGRIAVGWLIVEDLLTVLVLVLLPTIAPFLGGVAPSTPSAFGPLAEIGIALAKAGVFAVLMVVVGIRIVPWLLGVVAREGSRELFTLGVLATALGLAYVASAVFGVSFALGAFLAGAVVSESDMSHQAAADALPLRDAFAVLFFVSVGMLVDPAYLLAEPLAIAAVVAVIVVVNSTAAFGLVALLGSPPRIGLTVAAGVAQIGEFSFILATLGGSLGLLRPEGLQLIIAGAVVSITLNPFVFRAVEPLARRIRESSRFSRWLDRTPATLATLPSVPGGTPRTHAVICGFGRVGGLVAAALTRRGFPYVAITEDRREVERLRAEGVAALYGDAANPALLREAHLETARVLVIALRDAHVARLIVEHAHAMYPDLPIVVRTHDEGESTELRERGDRIQPIHGELELAVQMTRYALRRFGVSSAEAELIAQGLRDRGGRNATLIGEARGRRR